MTASLRLRAAVLALGLLGALGRAERAQAQGTCTVNFRASCVVGGTAAAAMTVSIPSVVRLQMASPVVGIGSATAADFTAGFGAAIAVPLTVKANRSWTVSLAATSTVWSATGPAARTNKPAGDLQWALAAGGAYADLSTVLTSIGTGAATSGTVISLFVRTRYAWALDTPGAYSLPLQLTITAP